MTRRKRDLNVELERSAALLRTLREEVRVEIHLRGPDAKEAWSRLEPSLEDALERAARDVSEGSHAVLAELAEAHRRLREWHR